MGVQGGQLDRVRILAFFSQAYRLEDTAIWPKMTHRGGEHQFWVKNAGHGVQGG